MDFLTGKGFFAMFAAVFFLIFAVFLFIIITAVVRAAKNGKAPRLTVAATVVTKRIRVSHFRNSSSASSHFSGSTYYFVTFQVQSGDRMELRVSGEEYGMLAEGDAGSLTFQETRYIGFEREGQGSADKNGTV